MKVFVVVFENPWNDHKSFRLFSTEAKAQEWAKENCKLTWWVEEEEVH